jgi:hypothetical protein
MSSASVTGRHAAPTGRGRHRCSRRRHRRPPKGGAALLGVAGGLSLVLSTLLTLHAQGETAVGRVPSSAPTGGAAATVGDALPPSRGSPATAAPGAQRSVGFVPDRIAIPRLAVEAVVVPMAVGADRSLGVPDDPAVLGWWGDGAQPGGPDGSVVLDGHVDNARSGPGVLFHLQTLVPGDVVTVSGQGRSARYVVAARRQYSKATLPGSVFDQQVAGRLVLITCGGSFDRRSRHYADNVVVFARPA